MTELTKIAMPEKMTDIVIFDSDTHWTEPSDLWTSRAPAKFKDKVMHVQRSVHDTEFWYIGDKRVSMLGACVVRPDLSKALTYATLPNRESMTAASSSVPDRLALMDKLGVGSQIIYPNAIGFGASTLLHFDTDEELRLFHIRAYNDALADVQKESGNRLLGQMALPFWNIEESIKEMERGRRMGLTGVTMTEQPGDWKQPAFVDPVWNPFWEAAQSLALPLNFHIASGSMEALLEAPTYWGDRKMFLDDEMVMLNGRYAAYQGTMLQMANQATILNLLVSGLLDRYPKLKFVSVESGISWTPFLLQSLENQFREMIDAQTRSTFKRSPREAFKDQIYVTYWFEDGPSVDYYVKMMGCDNVMFQTDFPHPVSLYPGVQLAAVSSTANLSDSDRRKILCGNAERLYGIKVGEISAS